MTAPHASCLLCDASAPETLLVDEFDEVYCRDCWDGLPEDEKEGAATRSYLP